MVGSNVSAILSNTNKKTNGNVEQLPRIHCLSLIASRRWDRFAREKRP